ncbi:MAG TPA: acylphosphatase [Chlorobaculum sp.]|nr:acylphosphatase [Chlorobaculum sp.]
MAARPRSLRDHGFTGHWSRRLIPQEAEKVSFKINEEVMLKREHLIVSGEVQGVGFRKFIDRKAKELNLSGWVKNRDDGTVEINVQGPENALHELLKNAIKGPERSKVVSVQKMPREADRNLDGFAIIS